MKKHPPPNGKNGVRDPNQNEFGIIWELSAYPYKLRAGDVFKFNERLCRVVRVNYSSAVVIMSQPVREFKTRFDKPVKFQPPPKRFYISPDSEVTVLNRKVRR
ncbi:MAG: hypothetical protein WCH99_21315 [Verrucomicrobiota bacterium]